MEAHSPALLCSFTSLTQLDVSYNPSLCGTVPVVSNATVTPSATLAACPGASLAPSPSSVSKVHSSSSGSKGAVIGPCLSAWGLEQQAALLPRLGELLGKMACSE